MGEVVAGRVQKVDFGVITVDLFGKATAMADEYEPREVPVLPDPVPSAEDGADTTAVATEGGETAEAAAAQVSEGAPEAVSSAEASVAAEPAAVPATVSEAESAPERVDHSDHVEHEEPARNAEAVSSSGDVHAVGADDDESDDEHEAAASIEPEREKPAAPALGQVFKGRVGAVSESGHIAILNRLIDSRAVREQLSQFREQHKRVHGMVFGYNRGGFDVLVEGLRAFCPASAMSLDDIIEPLDYVGKKLEFLLPASKAGSKDIIVSRRSILERLQRRKTKEFLRGLTPGQRFKGRVTAVRDFGLFVDIGGVEGLVHQSELSYAFGVKPNSVAKAGDEIEVQVLRVGGDARN
ncbi:MAG: hypothetical protein RL701_4545, partial [Pseudomonadota bacterium]